MSTLAKHVEDSEHTQHGTNSARFKSKIQIQNPNSSALQRQAQVAHPFMHSLTIRIVKPWLEVAASSIASYTWLTSSICI
jgi:hypothetical protein